MTEVASLRQPCDSRYVLIFALYQCQSTVSVTLIPWLLKGFCKESLRVMMFKLGRLN